MMNPKSPYSKGGRALRFSYLVTLFFLTLTGFAQMPIFKRYYIADIPGLGWLNKFFVTHYMHYLFAILFLGLVSYIFWEYVFSGRKSHRITGSGYFRGGIILGLVLTGALLVVRNFTGPIFSPGFIIFLDLSHLALVMLLLFSGVFCLIFKKRWLGDI